MIKPFNSKEYNKNHDLSCFGEQGLDVKNNGVEKMKLKVEPSRKLADGKHKGIIVNILYREQPFKYTDVVIKTENEVEVKAGYPTSLAVDSKLYALMTRFGVSMVEGNNADPDVLLQKEVQFISMIEGKFSKVIPESVKPL